MSAPRPGGPGLAVAATLAGGVAAVLAAMALSALAQPANHAARLAALDIKLDRLQRLERTSPIGPTYPKGAVCHDGVTRGAAQVEQGLKASLGQARLSHLAFAPDATNVGLAPNATSFQFDLEGSYEDAMTVLGALDAARPTIFADTVDLQTRTTKVALHFSGRFYCSPSARL